MSEESLLKLCGIHKHFIDNVGCIHHVLNDVDIELKSGECIGIVGQSGCGKSTLAKVICHLLRANKGEIFFKGRNVTQLPAQKLKKYYKSIQMIFQDPLGTFSPRMKIGRYLAEPFINFNLMSKKEAGEYSKELLELVGLASTYTTKFPNELSGGELQRVVIARAIGLNPEVIICDECTSALDVSIQKQILNLLQELKESRGFSSVFITHDLAIAESMCDRIYIMNCGEVQEEIRGGSIKKNSQHPYTKMLLDAVFHIEQYV